MTRLTTVTSPDYRGADKSLARPTSRCIFLMVRIFLLMLVLHFVTIMMLLSILYFAFCYNNDVTVPFVFGILLQY